MKRILFLSNMYPPHHLGGYELSCRDVVERHRERGHEVAVLTTTMRVPDVSDLAGERERGVLRDLQFYFRDGDLWTPPRWRRVHLERHNHAVLRRTLEEFRPDVVSVWHMGAMSLGLLTALVEDGVSLVFAVCDDWLIYGPELDGWLRMFAGRPRLARIAGRLARLPTSLPDLGRSGVFCFVSDFTRARAEEKAPWHIADSTVVYSGIDRRDFRVVPPEQERPWQWRLLYVGRLDARKGIETVLRSLALLPADARLDIVGRGPASYRSRLEAMVEELGLAARVDFAAADRSELAQRYASADAVVFPSEWEEPFGLVPVEAMACETPVVATGTGGSAEFLADGVNCLLFRPGDHQHLAATLQRLAADPKVREQIRVGGRATARELTIERLAETFEAWHVAAADEFADGRPPPRHLAGSDRSAARPER